MNTQTKTHTRKPKHYHHFAFSAIPLNDESSRHRLNFVSFKLWYPRQVCVISTRARPHQKTTASLPLQVTYSSVTYGKQKIRKALSYPDLKPKQSVKKKTFLPIIHQCKKSVTNENYCFKGAQTFFSDSFIEIVTH